MKENKYIRITLAIVILLFILILIFKIKNNTEIITTDLKKLETTSKTQREPSKQSENVAIFSDFAPLYYTKVETTTLGELAKKYQYFENTKNSATSLSLYTDDLGNVIKITRNSKYYKSVSRISEAKKEIENGGYHIKNLGNNIFNTNNRDAMLILIYSFDKFPFSDSDARKNHDTKTEVEIIPVTFISKNNDVGLETDIEIIGLLWNYKRDYIYDHWREDERFRNIHLEDYIASYWNLYPIYLPKNPDSDPRFSKYIIDASKDGGTFLPELRITGE